MNVFDFCQVRKVYFVTSEQLNEDDLCVIGIRGRLKRTFRHMFIQPKNSIVSDRRFSKHGAQFPWNFEIVTNERELLKGNIPTRVV